MDVLGLVRELVIVAVPAGGEERDRNAIARVFVVIAAAVDVLRVAVGVEGVVEYKGLLLLLVHCLDDVAQLRGQPATSDQLEVMRAAARNVGRLAAPDHVHVELRNDRITRDGWMIREPLRTVKSQLFSRVPDEHQRALRPWIRQREFFGDLEECHGA